MCCKNTREALLINPVRFTSYTFKAVNGESSYHVVRVESSEHCDLKTDNLLWST